MNSILEGSSLSSGRIGFGAMHLSERGRPTQSAALETVHAALDAGVRLVDTADAYCQHVGETGHNELLVAEALRSWSGDRAEVTIATKGGHVRDRYGRWRVDGRPEHLVSAAHWSRQRLGVDIIQLYQFHRPDPSVEFASSVAALSQLQSDGVVLHVGLSNVDVAQIERASDIVHIATIQNELSPLNLDSLPVVKWCHDTGVPFIAWAPFGGRQRIQALKDDPLLQPFRDRAADMGVSLHQLVLAWLVSLSPVVIPIPGASRPITIRATVTAGKILLDEHTTATLDDAVVQCCEDPETCRQLDEIRSRPYPRLEESA